MRFQLWLACLMFVCGVRVAHAEEPPCGVRFVTETTQLVYPVIARAAHATGVVIVRAEFARDGRVQSAEVWQGPPMLRETSLIFVKGLHANDYGGSRTCLLSIRFRMEEMAVPADFHGDQLAFLTDRSQTDPLHYTVVGRTVPLYSPNPSWKIVRRRFLGIF